MIRPVFYVCGLFVVNLGNLHYKGMVLIYFINKFDGVGGTLGHIYQI